MRVTWNWPLELKRFALVCVFSNSLEPRCYKTSCEISWRRRRRLWWRISCCELVLQKGMHTDGMLDESFHVFHVDVFQLRKYSSYVNTLNIMFFQCVLFHTHTFYLKMEGLTTVFLLKNSTAIHKPRFPRLILQMFIIAGKTETSVWIIERKHKTKIFNHNSTTQHDNKYILKRCMSGLKMPSKFIKFCILHITFSDTQLCGRCLINMTPVVKVVIHCIFALL